MDSEMDELLRHLRSRFLVADVATWDKFTSGKRPNSHTYGHFRVEH